MIVAATTLVEVTMKFFHILSFSIVIFTMCINVTTACDHNITRVAMNSTSFPCPVDVVNCNSTTMNDLITSKAPFHTICSNEFIFQSESYDVKKIGSSSLALKAYKDLIFLGQRNVIIRCVDDSTISLSVASNITVREIQFQDCNIELVTSKLLTYSSIEIANSTFVTSKILLSGAYSNSLLVIMENIIVINSSLTLERANRIDVNGKDSSIECTNAEFLLKNVKQGEINLHDTNLHDCSNIVIKSRTKMVAITTKNTLFNNSCLKFEASLTNSPYHCLLITMTKTKVEQCSCKFTRLFTKVGIHINITLDRVIVTHNYLPFIESEDNHPVSISLKGDCVFHQNKNFLLLLNNGSVLFSKANVSFTNCTVDTTAARGAPIYAKDSTITFEESSVLFSQNQGSYCGGIVADATQIYFKNNVNIIFHNNSGPNGGALSLYSESRLHFNASLSNIVLYFQNNTAQIGGAIYVDDSRYKNIESVFQLHCDPANVRLTFSDSNVASLSGNQIYGGWIDWFVNETVSSVPENQMDVVNTFIKFENQTSMQDLVSSHPIRICLCTNNKVDCSITNHNMTIYGQALTLDLVGVGQRYTPVISHVEASLVKKTKSNIHHPNNIGHQLKILQSACTKVNYKINSHNKEETIIFKPYLPYLYYSGYFHYVLTEGIDHNLFQQLMISLEINECPWGFINQTNGSCECQVSIQGLQCDMNNYTILRSGQQWVGTTHEYNRGNNNPGIIAHQHCPFDYCRTDNESLSIRLENQDEQCAFNREGILCGGCKERLSRVLGTSNCIECTNKYTPLIAVSWLVSGIILVICLMLLNLTVSVGTINGLTFYANIIRAQYTTFFTPDISKSFLSTFIAWFNLDSGIEMCLYNGLDSYVITWLQYVYPLYVWLIAAIIIILSHYSSRISKLCGKNAVQVLATLFLISYTRLLRLMIEVFSFTWITYPDGHMKAVWLVDGNYEFFRGKLIPLVLVTIFFVLLSLPYTISVLTIQFLHRISHYRVLFWVRRLKPFFDAYTGPYKSRHRYWTGLLLVARIALLITFSVNQSNNLSINLLAIVTVSVVLLGWHSSANWVYDSSLNNFLEIIFLSNLVLTSAAVLFNVSNGKNTPVAIYLSTSVAFFLLIFITLYHIHRRLVLTKLGSKLTVKVMHMLSIRSATIADDSNELSDIDPSTSGHNEVTSTMIELNTQPCSHMYASYNSHDLKEPLLEESDDN